MKKTRLSVIATRTGDAGQTGLGDGSRVSKDGARVIAKGDVGELNSIIGLWRTEALPEEIDKLLGDIQHRLFDLGGELCIPDHRVLIPEHVSALDDALDHYNGRLSKLEEFILPGGTRGAALAHLARTVCRRAERSIVTLGQKEVVREPVRQYVNRLSDLCFVLARVLNKSAGVPDVLWDRKRNA